MRRSVEFDAVVLFSALFIAELAAILLLNDGQFVYSLDDPYIHLALARRIAHGHYGVNANEPSAPSSSILWPFLLAAFGRLQALQYVPLALNYLASLFTLGLAGGFLEDCSLLPGRPAMERALIDALLVLILVSDNLLGLAFTGMEHSLHVLCTVAVLAGMAKVARDGRVPWYLAAAIVAGPLVRYEGLAVSLPALAYLWWRGHRRTAGLCAAAVAAALASYSAYLHALGLGYVPTAILTKTFEMERLHPDGGSALGLLANNVSENLALSGTKGALLLALGLLLPGLGPYAEGRRGVALAVASAAGLHLLLGSFNERYEWYAIALVLLALPFLYQDRLRALGKAKPVLASSATLALLVLPACALFGTNLDHAWKTPLASNNIYEQQYQMKAFSQEYYRAPVAVNDLGLVSFENPNYVLDLWGLANLRSLAQRASPGAGNGWMGGLAREHGVHLAIIYERWFKVPADWILLCRMTLGKPSLSPADHTVSFFALDGATAAEAGPELRRFAQTVPSDVLFYFPEPGKAVEALPWEQPRRRRKPPLGEATAAAAEAPSPPAPAPQAASGP